MLVRLLVIVLMITACGKPAPKAPLKEPVKEHRDRTEQPIVAPPAKYGNKIV